MNKGKSKSLTVNAIFNVMYRVVGVVFPFVTLAWASHVLLADGIGKVVFAQNIAQYFILLAPLGILNYGTREIARRREDSQDASQVFSELFFINLISTLLCTALYYALVSLVSPFSEDRILFYITGLPILMNVFNVDWFYQGREEYVYIAIRSIIVKALSMVLVISFVKTSQDYMIYALIYVFGFAGNYILNMINLRHAGICFVTRGLRFRRHIKAISVLLASSIAVELYTLVDTSMLGVMCGDEVVGYYSNAMKLDRVAVGMVTAIGAVLLPRLSYYQEKGLAEERNSLVNRVAEIMMYLCVPLGCGIFVLAEPIVNVCFGSSFAPAAITLRIGVGLIFVLALSNLYGTQVLLAFFQEKKLLACTVIGALTNVVLNLILIPSLENNGAAIASVVSETIVAIMSFAYAKKYVKVQIRCGVVVKTIISTGLMSAAIAYLGCLIGDPLLYLLLAFALGASIYLFASVCLRNSLLVDLLAKKTKRNSK